MSDQMDRLLTQLPSPPSPPDLARRICLSMRNRRQAQPSPFAWAGRRTRIFAWDVGLAGLVLLVLLLFELMPVADWQQVMTGLFAWMIQLWLAPADTLLALRQVLLAGWQIFTGLGLTVLPLALSLLALAAFAMASCRLSLWTDQPLQTGDN